MEPIAVDQEWDGTDRRAPKTFWQGNSIRFWRGLVIVSISVLGFFLSLLVYDIRGNRAALAEIPKVYAEKNDLRIVSKKIDRLTDKVDEINRFLRDQ